MAVINRVEVVVANRKQNPVICHLPINLKEETKQSPWLSLREKLSIGQVVIILSCQLVNVLISRKMATVETGSSSSLGAKTADLL